jgi:hypothetical protein
MQAEREISDVLIKGLGLCIADGCVEHHTATIIFTRYYRQAIQQRRTDTLTADFARRHQVINVAKAAVNKILQQAITCQCYRFAILFQAYQPVTLRLLVLCLGDELCLTDQFATQVAHQRIAPGEFSGCVEMFNLHCGSCSMVWLMALS